MRGARRRGFFLSSHHTHASLFVLSRTLTCSISSATSIAACARTRAASAGTTAERATPSTIASGILTALARIVPIAATATRRGPAESATPSATGAVMTGTTAVIGTTARARSRPRTSSWGLTSSKLKVCSKTNKVWYQGARRLRTGHGGTRYAKAQARLGFRVKRGIHRKGLENLARTGTEQGLGR